MRFDVGEAAGAMKIHLATALATEGDDPPDEEIAIDARSMEVTISPDGPEVSFAAPEGFGADEPGDLTREEAVTTVWYQRQSVDDG